MGTGEFNAGWGVRGGGGREGGGNPAMVQHPIRAGVIIFLDAACYSETRISSAELYAHKYNVDTFLNCRFVL